VPWCRTSTCTRVAVFLFVFCSGIRRDAIVSVGVDVGVGAG